jgi:hypothetical protein
VRMLQPKGFLIAIALTVLLAACAHADREGRLPEEQFPDPADPAYPAVILQAREERVREIQARENSLEAVDRMIDLRESGVGRSSGVTGDTGLQNMRLEIRRELTSARARLARLERKVRQDFGGEYPPWWPKGTD